MEYNKEKLIDTIVSDTPDYVIKEFENKKYADDFNSILGWDKFGRPVFVDDIVAFSYGPTSYRAVVIGDGGIDHNGDHRVALCDSPWPTATFGSIMVLIDESPEHIARFVRDMNRTRMYINDVVFYAGDFYEVADYSFDKVYLRPTMVCVGRHPKPVTVPSNAVTLQKNMSPIRDR